MILQCNNACVVFAVYCVLFGFLVSKLNAQDTTSASAIAFTPAEIELIRVFGPWPQEVPDDPGNEYSRLLWAENLGKKLFSDSDLSGNRNIACSTCHQPDRGFTDGLQTAVGVSAHVRNTQTLLNVGYQRWCGWDGGTDSLWAASLRPLFSDIEMDANLAIVAKRFRHKPYFVEGLLTSSAKLDVDTLDDEALIVLIGKMIGAYTRTIVSGETDFDRFRQSLLIGDIDAQRQFPEAAKRGLRIFIGEANCHVCHFGPNFSNGEFHDTGRPFFTGVGKVDPGRYNGIKRVRKDKYNLTGRYNGVKNPQNIRKTTSVKLGQTNFGEWRTPSLRNLTSTAPYMHDGSIATLRGVVDAYADIDLDRLHADGESILKPLDLDEQAREDLVEFLITLSNSSTP